MLYRVRLENTPFWHNPERREFFSPDPLGISNYQNVHIKSSQKWLGFDNLVFFYARQIEIIKYSCS